MVVWWRRCGSGGSWRRWRRSGGWWVVEAEAAEEARLRRRVKCVCKARVTVSWTGMRGICSRTLKNDSGFPACPGLGARDLARRRRACEWRGHPKCRARSGARSRIRASAWERRRPAGRRRAASPRRGGVSAAHERPAKHQAGKFWKSEPLQNGPRAQGCGVRDKMV
jgi:hypothetical protein